LTDRLQLEAIKHRIKFHRKTFSHIEEAFELCPNATAVFNYTGLGSLNLGGVEDKKCLQQDSVYA
jgi:hypothetical protein